LGISLARLTDLRELRLSHSKLYVDEPAAPFARLTRLKLHDTYLIDEDGNECDRDLARSLFSPAQIPVLHHIAIDCVSLGEDCFRFSLLLPQLSNIEFSNIPLSLVATQLPSCTSLTKLRLVVDSTEDPPYLLAYFDSLRKLHLEEFRYWNWGNSDGETCLDNVRRTMAIVGEMKTLKKLSLGIDKIYTNIVTRKKWIEFRQGARKICEKKKIHIFRFDDDHDYQDYDIHELIWVD
jgi:hypothetical protein